MDNKLIMCIINFRITKLYYYQKYEDFEYTVTIN